MITSVDREGTGLGYDVALTKKIAEAVSIPVIACGGAGKLEHIEMVISEGKADAVAIASLLHYDFIKYHKVEIYTSREGNVEFLESGRAFSKVSSANLKEIKSYLLVKGYPCRHLS